MESASRLVGTLISHESPREEEVSNIFLDYASRNSLFKNPEILSHNFIPKNILYREEEMRILSNILAPLIKRYKPNNAFIYGTIGTGKTITTKFVVSQLNRLVAVKTIYINCKMRKVADTEYRLLAQILKEYGIFVPETGISTNTLYSKFFEVVNAKPLVLVLDEIDALVEKIGDEFLYSITRSNTNITLIGITNNLIFYDSLDPRVKSALCEEKVIFKPYNATQLKDILAQRSLEAFYCMPNDSVLNKCAAIAAQENGDARKSLEILKVAAELADRAGSERIGEEHVDMAYSKINLDKVAEVVCTLPKQSQLIFLAVMKLKEKLKEKDWADIRILSGDVYRIYKKLAAGEGLKILTDRRLSDFVNELEALGLISTKVISKGRYGRSKEIKLMVSEDMQLKIERIMAESGLR